MEERASVCDELSALRGLVDDYLELPTGDETGIVLLKAKKGKELPDGWHSCCAKEYAGRIGWFPSILLAQEVSRKVGRKHTLPSLQRLYDQVDVDNTLRQLLRNNSVFTRERIEVESEPKFGGLFDGYNGTVPGKVIPDPTVRVVDGEYRYEGKGVKTTVFYGWCIQVYKTLHEAGLFREEWPYGIDDMTKLENLSAPVTTMMVNEYGRQSEHLLRAEASVSWGDNFIVALMPS